jgi:hypothetical protein
MSMPRCPDEYFVAGAMNGRTILCVPRTGHAHFAATAVAAAGVPAEAAATIENTSTKAASRTSR